MSSIDLDELLGVDQTDCGTRENPINVSSPRVMTEQLTMPGDVLQSDDEDIKDDNFCYQCRTPANLSYDVAVGATRCYRCDAAMARCSANRCAMLYCVKTFSGCRIFCDGCAYHFCCSLQLGRHECAKDAVICNNCEQPAIGRDVTKCDFCERALCGDCLPTPAHHCTSSLYAY